MTDNKPGPAHPNCAGPGHGKDPTTMATTDQGDPVTETDQERQELHARLAPLLDMTAEQINAMSEEEIFDAIARMSFRGFALELALDHEEAEGVHLTDDGPREQADRAVAALEKFHAQTRLFPVRTMDISLNLFGFGSARVQYITFDDNGRTDTQYLLLSEVAEALAVPLHKAHEWARQDHLDAIRSQRERDEERGELGWECLRDLVDLELFMTVDDPEANPDAGGNRWSFAGDWLISDDRLLAFMTISPWCEEFIENAKPLFGHAFRATMGDKLKDIPTYCADGTPTGGNAYDDLARTDDLTVEEAAKRAMRGPSGPLADA